MDTKNGYRVYLDMDGVLADFVKGACKAHGTTLEFILPNWEPGVWDMTLAMNIPHSQFWREIDKLAAHFWERLEPTPFFNDIVKLVKELSDDWYVLTSPTLRIPSYTGKVWWLRKHFGGSFDRFHITPYKHLFAGPGVLLIDDREKNVNEFVQAGGDGLLFPSYLNKLYEYKDDPVDHLREILGMEKNDAPKST